MNYLAESNVSPELVVMIDPGLPPLPEPPEKPIAMILHYLSRYTASMKYLPKPNLTREA